MLLKAYYAQYYAGIICQGLVMRSLTDDIESLCIVKECRELKTSYGTNFTDTILMDANNISLQEDHPWN